MKQIRKILPRVSSAVLTLLAATVMAEPAVAADDRLVELSPYAGYRLDVFEFQIAGNLEGTNPNVLSEVEWRDMEILEVGLAGRAALPFGLAFRTNGGYGWIFKGENRDSDYAGNNRTLEFSRSLSDAGDGYVWHAQGGAGYRFTLLDGDLALTPLLGYSEREQHLTIFDGHWVIPRGGGRIHGLDSSYKTRWHTAWAGLDAAWDWRDFRFSGAFEYHRGWFEAWGNWNLRRDLAHPVSLYDEADANGWTTTGVFEWRAHDRVSIGARAGLRIWITEEGKAYQYKADGRISVTRLNHAKWYSASWSATATFHF